ncbi:MAG TPA: hypothetical protein VKF17_16800 [Isosphaeraceae bacterium]|nr:hypothetical protein [Isosphaeraceae bacterium]
MASEESAALKILQGQVESLTTQLQTLTSERDEYRDALSEVASERDGLKTQISSPDELTAELADLKQQIRDRAHYDKFSELAKGSKAKEAALKHLWKLAEYDAKDDEPNENALAEVVKRLKTEADYAFDPEEHTTTTAAREAAEREWSGKKHGLPAPRETPAAGGRSARNQGGDGTIVTAEMRADPKFMLDPKNRELIATAAKEGRFR